MTDKKLMVDSTILIDYFRKTDKEKSRLVAVASNATDNPKLPLNYPQLAVDKFQKRFRLNN